MIHLKLRAFLLAEIVFRQLKDFRLELAESLIEQKTEEKLNEGLEICKELVNSCKKDSKKQIEIHLLITKALIFKGNHDKVDIYFDTLEKLGATAEQSALVKAILLKTKSDQMKAFTVLEPFVDSSLCSLEIGRIFYDLKKFEESLQYTLKATKLQPYNSECFFLLGKIYLATHDEIRCKKCFEKCLNLNPQNEKAILVLSAMYRESDEFDANLVMLENAINAVEGAYQKTALLQLGFHHLATSNYDKVRILNL